MSSPTMILETDSVSKYFDQSTSVLEALLKQGSKVQAVDDVSLQIKEGDSIGVIGESGCGKTTLLKTLIGLYEPTHGEISYDGKIHSEFDKKDWKEYRRNVTVIFQDPYKSFNPKLTVEEILSEPLKIHNIEDRESRIIDILHEVKLNPPESYIDRIPAHLSGGERQRLSIARALITDPKLVLADEPVSMLDVSTQAAILKLLSTLMEERGTSLMYISHDISTVSYICDRINVMYLGRIIETAPTKNLIDDPKHPYTQALINAVPIPNPFNERERTSVTGVPPNPVDLGEGCRFRDRCPERMDICEKTPRHTEIDKSEVACHLYYNHQQPNNNQQKVDQSGQSSRMSSILDRWAP